MKGPRLPSTWSNHLRVKVEQAVAWGDTKEEILSNLPVSSGEFDRILANMVSSYDLAGRKEAWTDEEGTQIRSEWEHIPPNVWRRKAEIVRELPETCSIRGGTYPRKP